MAPPPESYEKRQRDRKKQRKRKEKLERRLQRNAEKRYERTARANAVAYRFCRGEEEHLVDGDVWLCVLDLAAAHGWVPSERVEQDSGEPSYAHPVGMRISEQDALNLAQSIDAELDELSDEPLEPSDADFGADHTEALLALRSEGQTVPTDEVVAAREVLSGPPKWGAERLGKFLRGGSFVVDEV